MLLTITNSQTPANDLSYLLHKHPNRLQSFSTSFGQVHLFYPESSSEVCTVALLMDVDPIGLIRSGHRGISSNFALEQYVNDRPYAVSSFMSVSIAKVIGSALSGKCKDKPELVSKPLQLTAKLPVLPCRGGEGFLRGLFEPLEYQVEASRLALDEKFPEWGQSNYFSVSLSRHCPLQELLTHLYVLIPVLDNDKHYWVSEDEVQKLLRHGEGWLEEHPQKEAIAFRYLKHQRRLTKLAMSELVDADEVEAAPLEVWDAQEEEVEKSISLNERRYEAVLEAVQAVASQTIVDLGCGEGKLVKGLLKIKSLEKILGTDVSIRSLEIAAERLRLDDLPERVRRKVELMQSSLMYRDKRISGFDVACVVEVIEHLDVPRLAAFERVVFEFAQPKRVIVTTPNSEYNVKFANLPAGKFRHKDHRFEWTRKEFQNWGSEIAARYNYSVEFSTVGPVDKVVGSPTQMGVFDHED
ncbi:MAG: 3' terminal RNA ribose 2'-O-methyltransferase Hen1 [Symploca sp. SIO2E6]|nr:3' terminal RNA ribose 2'-O-methyltransferase Hen1 [Symploca sp. SIO2E6]